MKANFPKFFIGSTIAFSLGILGNTAAYAEEYSRPFECSFKSTKDGPGGKVKLESDEEFREREPHCFRVTKQEGPIRKPVTHGGPRYAAKQDDVPQMIIIEDLKEPSPKDTEEKGRKHPTIVMGIGAETVLERKDTGAVFIEAKFDGNENTPTAKTDLEEYTAEFRGGLVKTDGQKEFQIQKLVLKTVQPFADGRMTYLAGARIFERDFSSISNGSLIPNVGLGTAFGKTNTKTHIGFRIYPMHGYTVTAHDSKSNGGIATSGELFLAQRLGPRTDLDAKIEAGAEWNKDEFDAPSPLAFLKTALGITVRPGEKVYVKAEAIHQRAEKRDLTPPTTSSDYAHGAGARMTEVKLSAGVVW